MNITKKSLLFFCIVLSTNSTWTGGHTVQRTALAIPAACIAGGSVAGILLGMVTGDLAGRLDNQVLAHCAPNPLDLLSHNTSPSRLIIWLIEAWARLGSTVPAGAAGMVAATAAVVACQRRARPPQAGDGEILLVSTMFGGGLSCISAGACAWLSSWISYMHRIRTCS